MDDIELQFKQIKEFGVLKWNIAEDITNIQKQVMNTSIGLLQKLKFLIISSKIETILYFKLSVYKLSKFLFYL